MGVVAPPLPAIPGADRDRLSNFWRNAAARSRVATTAVSFRHLALGRAGVGSGQLLRRRKSVLSIGADGAVVADKAAGEGERSLAGEDGLTREVVDLAFPALLGQAIEPLALLTETAFVGRLDTKTPLYATAIASSSNIVLGAFLMFGLRLGVAGAAVAYGAAQFAMMSYLLWCLNKRAILLPPKLKDLKFERFFKNGGLLLGRTLSILSIMTLSTSMATRQGTLPMAAHQVCIQLWLATSLLSDSLAIAVQALLARAFAKRDYRRAKLVTFRVLQMGFVLGMIMAGVIGTSSGFLSKLFTKDEKVLKVMFTIMPFVALTQPLNSLAFVFDGIHYGASDFRYATHAMMVNALASSAVLLYAPRVLGLSGVWVGLTLVMGLRAGAGFLRLALETGPWSFLKEKLDG